MPGSLTPETVRVDVPEIRYAKSGDVHIAYQVLGVEPLDLVLVPGFISHLEYGWHEPRLAAFLRRLASFSRLIVFDKRGTGLSDQVHGVATLEERMDDVRAVMDAVGSERAVVCGMSEGAAMTALFAGTYPERTSGAILYGAEARSLRAPDYPWGGTRERAEVIFADALRRWGTQELADEDLRVFAPSVADNPEVRRWWATYLRMSATPAALRELFEMNLEIDIREVLPTIRVPSLVLNRAEDQVVPAAVARYVADLIPGASYVEVPGPDHYPWFGDSEAVIVEIERFVHGLTEEAAFDRVLATVLFTDIVGSTAKAAALGDRAWRDLLHAHHTLARSQLARFRGKEVDTAGDGFFATFDGPARAIRCACAITESMRDLGLDVRAGLHTGECELMQDKVGGIAVHIGARVAAEAGPGEVLVSSTVKDLVAGSGIGFRERGTAELKGVPGEWRLYAVERS